MPHHNNKILKAHTSIKDLLVTLEIRIHEVIFSHCIFRALSNIAIEFKCEQVGWFLEFSFRPLLEKTWKHTYNIYTSFVTLRYLNVTEVKIFVTLNEILF